MNRIVVCALALVVGVLLLATPSAALTCGGISVDYVWTYAQSGTLVATITSAGLSGAKGWALCSLSSTVGSINPDMCRTIYTQLVVAKTTGKTVAMAFSSTIPNSSGQAALTCDEIQTFKLNEVAPYLQWVRLDP